MPDLPKVEIPKVKEFKLPEIPKFDLELPDFSQTELSFSIPDYSMNIPSRVDIFSELPIKLFDDSYNEQIAKVMRRFRKEYIKSIHTRERKAKAPKLLYYVNEDENSESVQMHSEWKEGNALLYFQFESDRKESSMGIIWNDDQIKNYETRAANIHLSDLKELIHEAIDFIYRVY